MPCVNHSPRHKRSMSILSRFFWRRQRPPPAPLPSPPPTPEPSIDHGQQAISPQRHFYNERGFQCYASFFPYWDGWVTAGHVLTDAGHKWPVHFSSGDEHIWPGGLDAALNGCRLPHHPPPAPVAGQQVIVLGFPAGSRHLETRRGAVYIERGTGSGTWIAHIKTPDEPVVSGMSGGPVIDTATGLPIGILITRNSPADLNADRDPDESCDFISLRAVWEAVQGAQNIA